MHTFFMAVSLSGLMLITGATSLIPTEQAAAAVVEEVPAYAKWGKMAVKATMAKYPDAEIVDYLYSGNEEQDDSRIEKFKLWLREGDKEFGVRIHIKHHVSSEKVEGISFEETSN
ncbi:MULTISPECIES: DUF3889 domain-containing protein [Virgibacillus]|uniref:DUF3889 domain-containing protein n=1 Tax=Virgibacillus salarius TaxID=447199 RepID=A0A941DZP9_9BACI|nr:MULTISPECIES: DUF3889 domain-containing protein [Bacillaceae]MBR7797113.1 DUF3889 domain-containing protein [Virgibacillus salarius]NAZ09822.1 DUF3889 domain-containing protein [Agaribacter marinus]WBX81460.1 DUF3889 domain-containing protein [Virgibacillus salarius]